MLLKDKRVAIIGAGPVGLTMARLLQQAGVNVDVYERDKNQQTRIWGGTLDLHKNSGQKVLEKAGILDAYYSSALPMGICFTNEKGEIISTRDVKPQSRYDNPEINRNQLRTIMLDSLNRGTVIWDSRFIGLERQDNKWLIHFDNQLDAFADVVIAANGGMSAARKYLTHGKIEDTGTFIIQGDVPKPEINCPLFYELCSSKRLMAAYNGNLLVANPYNAGALTYGIIFKKPLDWTDTINLDFNEVDDVKYYLSGRFKGWDKRFFELINATTLFVGLPTRIARLQPPWKFNRPLPITLIGDAAHLMPPFAGQGVNIGLVDALILAENLTQGKFDTIEAAIEDYEQQMFVYAIEAQHQSTENELKMRQPDFSFQKLLPEA